MTGNSMGRTNESLLSLPLSSRDRFSLSISWRLQLRMPALIALVFPVDFTHCSTFFSFKQFTSGRFYVDRVKNARESDSRMRTGAGRIRTATLR